MSTNDLQTQANIEKEMVELGKNRYRKEIAEAVTKKHESTSPYGIQFIGNGAHRVHDELKLIISSYESGEVLMYPVEAIECLKLVPLDVCAFLALKTCVNFVSSITPIQKVALEVGTMIEDEYRLRNFKALNPALIGVITRDLAKRTTNYKKQKRVLVNSANKAGIDIGKLPVGTKVKLGTMLVDVISNATGLLSRAKKLDQTPPCVARTPFTKSVNSCRTACNRSAITVARAPNLPP